MRHFLKRATAALFAASLFLATALPASATNTFVAWKQEVVQATANTSIANTATVSCELVTTGYTYATSQVFRSDISTGPVGTKVTMPTRTFVAAKVTSATVTFTAVPSGNTIGGMVCYTDTGTNTTSRMVVYVTLTSSVLSNGGDIGVNPDGTTGWFTL